MKFSSSFVTLVANTCNATCGPNARCVGDLAATFQCECRPLYWSPNGSHTDCIRKYLRSNRQANRGKASPCLSSSLQIQSMPLKFVKWQFPKCPGFVLLTTRFYFHVTMQPMTAVLDPAVEHSLVVLRGSLPTSSSALPVTVVDLAPVNALANSTLEYYLQGSPEISLTSQTLGINLQDENIVLTSTFTESLDDLTFPHQLGLTVSAQSDPECLLPYLSFSSLCTYDVTFAISIAEFSPACPANILAFSTVASSLVTWDEPELYSLSGPRLDLTTATPSESFFSQGKTVVSYQAVSDSLQPSNVLPTCSFEVSRRFMLKTLPC